MFFLVRTAFWLGLTFSAIDWPGERPALPSAGDFAAQATAQATRLCAGNPQACLEAAQTAQRINKAVEPEARPAKRKIDTLDSADRAPVWRGRG